MAELRRTQINMINSKGILKAPSAAAIRQLTTDHNLGLSVDFSEGGKPENPEKNPRSTGETKFLRINAGLYQAVNSIWITGTITAKQKVRQNVPGLYAVCR